MLKQVLKIGLGLSLIATAALAELEKKDLKIGFIPLTDCAALVIAKEKGFFAKHGLNVELSKEASWANVRDKMTVGELDASHMLAAMPIASTLGVGSTKKDMLALMALGTKWRCDYRIQQNVRCDDGSRSRLLPKKVLPLHSKK